MTTTAVTITGASSTGQQHQSADSGAQSSPGVTAPIRSARVPGPDPPGGAVRALAARVVALVKPSRTVVVAVIVAAAVVCVLMIVWAVGNLLEAFVRYRGSP